MCKNDSCSHSNDVRPAICVQDLSCGTQQYLRIASNAALGDAPGFAGHLNKLRNMADLTVEQCLLLDPCCTSKVSFDSARGLVNFLQNTTLPGQTDYRITQFILGKYDCNPGCC